MAGDQSPLPHSSIPTLSNVLHRRTLPPVCLFNFYIYLRDVEQVQHLLDFWLDVVAHENRCKMFCRTAIEQSLKRSSLLSDQSANTALPETISVARISLQDVNNELRYNAISNGQRAPVTEWTMRSPTSNDPSSDTPKLGCGVMAVDEKKSSEMADQVAGSPATVKRSTSRSITRAEIRNSASRLFYRYVVPGAPNEIPLPEAMRYHVVQAVETDRRDDPAVFEEAKEFIYGVLDAGAFPRFIHERLEHNVTRRQAMIRLGVGLLSIYVAFTVMLSLIFLDRPRSLRLWGAIPLVFGVVNLLVSQTRLSPLFALLRISELTFLGCHRIKDRYIITHHSLRALKITLLSLIISLLVMVVFYFIPGKRL